MVSKWGVKKKTICEFGAKRFDFLLKLLYSQTETEVSRELNDKISHQQVDGNDVIIWVNIKRLENNQAWSISVIVVGQRHQCTYWENKILNRCNVECIV